MNRIWAIIFCLFLSVMFIRAQSESIRLMYVEPPGEESPMWHYGVKLNGPFLHKKAILRMMHCVEGQMTVTVLNEIPFELQDTIQFFDFNAIPYKQDSVRISLQPAITGEIRLGMEDTLHNILLETYSEKEFTLSDTIPIMAYTKGAKALFNLDGKEVEGISYCNVRFAKKHPAEWYKLFDIQNYVYFEILIRE
jgi:hypothetical protein